MTKMKCNITNLIKLTGVKKTRRSTNEANELLKMVSIVIQSYDRQSFLLRQIAHWNESSISLLIFDQSPAPLNHEILEYIKKYKNIKYFYSDSDIYSRFSIAKNFIATPYTVFMGDDEFLLESGIKEAVSTLEEDSSQVGCIGQSCRFDWKGSGIPIQYRDGYDHYGYSVISHDYQTRINYLLGDYRAATAYAVLRTPVWIESFCFLKKYSHIPLSELEQGIVTMMYGGLKSINRLYWLRSDEQPTKFVKNIWEPQKVNFEDWWTKEIYAKEREGWAKELLRAANKAGLKNEEFKNILGASLNSYLIFIKSDRESGDQRIFSMINCRKLLARIWPIILSKKIIFQIRKKLNLTEEVDVNGLLLRVNKNQQSDSIAGELLDIENLIQEFYTLK